MASPNRPPSHRLAAGLRPDVDLRRAGLFPVVREIEARSPDKPRVGKAKRPDQSIVDFAQEPSLAFEAATLSAISTKRGRVQVRGNWLGLLGPMGPLPTHLTEYASYERQYAKQRPLGEWLELLSGRMLQYFYRAWADSQPAAHADRPHDDQFALWLAALSGATEGADANSAFPPAVRLHYAPLFCGLRSATAIEDGLSHLMQQPVKVTEFRPRWRDFEVDDRSRLGGSYATLGQDAVLGNRVFSAADAFSVTIRANSWSEFRDLMPNTRRFAIAAEAIEAFKPSHLEWDARIEIAETDIAPTRLNGNSSLGWSSWLMRPRQQSDGAALGCTAPVLRSDSHLNKFSIKKGKHAQ